MSSLLVVTAPAAAQTVATTFARPIGPVYRHVRPWYRHVRPWYRHIRPWYRHVRPWTDITATPLTTIGSGPNPYSGDLTAFWGKTDPVARASAGGAPAFAATTAFWDDLDTRWADIGARWEGAPASPLDPAYALVRDDLNALVASSKSLWGATIAKQTGQSFEAAFANPFLARFGVNLAGPASLAHVDPVDRARFYVEWYDGLMQFSGNDHADHWMRAINWTPRLTQTQGGGSRATVGLIDIFAASDADVRSKVIYSGGVSSFSNGHGAGVGSLILGAHDGKGVMGIAPNALIAAYNPFDANGTASWTDVRNGIIEVTKERGANKDRASVVNLSLGIPGWTFAPEWRDVFKTSAVDSVKDHTLYVIAAGNDGLSQTKNVEMNGALDSTFIVVGSIDPMGEISSFSNRPGTACLTDGGQCKYGDELKESAPLMNRFIVAPGELLLVSDGKGGVTRQSGTSLAAPLVAGAVALIQDRWPWLKKHPRDVAKAILSSAKDLGAPGIDPIYGVGLLDVEAAQSPLHYGNLKYYLINGGKSQEVAATTLTQASAATRSSWEAKGAYFTAFEKLEDKERDFLVPLSSRLVGTTLNGVQFQDYVYTRMATPAGSGGFTQRTAGFTDMAESGARNVGGGWAVSFTGRMAGGYARAGEYRPLRLNSAIALTAPDERFTLGFGQGDGALALGAGNGFAMVSDFDPLQGGANPLLGFAGGDMHLSGSVRATRTLTLGIGMTEQNLGARAALAGIERDPVAIAATDGYRARAAHFRADWTPARRVSVTAAYTRLGEDNALLGVRSLERSDFGGGTVSEGLTLSANLALGGDLALFGAATRSVSRAPDAGALRTGKGIASSAYQLGIAKRGVFGNSDTLRLTLAQPLHLERGTLEFHSIGVVDRETGEKGVVVQNFDIGGDRQRRLVAEGMYALTRGDKVSLQLFGRGELRGRQADVPAVQIGGTARLLF